MFVVQAKLDPFDAFLLVLERDLNVTCRDAGRSP